MLSMAWRGIHGISPGAPGSAWELCGRGPNGVRDHVQGECHTGRAWMSPSTCSRRFKFCSKFPTKWNGRQGYSCEVFCNVMRVPAKWLHLHVWFPGSPGRWGRTFLVLAPSSAKEAPLVFACVPDHRGLSTKLSLGGPAFSPHTFAILVGGRVLRHFWLAESVPLGLSLGDTVGPGIGASSEGIASAPRGSWVRLVLAFAEPDRLLNGSLFPWMVNHCPCSTMRMCRHHAGKAEGS